MLKLDITGFTEDEVIIFIREGLHRQQESIKVAIANLEGRLNRHGEVVTKPKRGRPAKQGLMDRAQRITGVHPAMIGAAQAYGKPAPPKPSTRTPLSPEARARIVAAQKKRWAKHRRDKKAANGVPVVKVKRAAAVTDAPLVEEAVQ